MKFCFNSAEENITLPKELLLNKIEQASPTELKVLLYAASMGNEFDEADIQNISGLDLTEIIIALQFWRGADVLSVAGQSTTVTAKPKKDNNKTVQKVETPDYTGDEVTRLFAEKSELKQLIDECQAIAGKMFNPLEINKIISLYDYLGLSAEYILLLYNYCKGKNKTTVHYVEKTAFNLYDEGVDTDEKLQEYIKYKEQFDSIAGKIRRIFGTSKRALTKKEEGFIRKWTETFKMPLEVIEYAYELTVNATNEASMPYASKILENWFSAGFVTLEQAKQAEFDYKKAKEDSSQQSASFDDDEFFEAALKRSYENLGIAPKD